VASTPDHIEGVTEPVSDVPLPPVHPAPVHHDEERVEDQEEGSEHQGEGLQPSTTQFFQIAPS
jgi:hypothetical protein